MFILPASLLLCLRSGPSSRQVFVTKHPKPSLHGSHTDQNTPANLAPSATATVVSTSPSLSSLAPFSHTGTNQHSSPRGVSSCRTPVHADAVPPQPTAPASEHAVQGYCQHPAAPNLAAATPANRQELDMSDVDAQDPSRQPFRVIHADSSASIATHLRKAAAPPPVSCPAQEAAQQHQLPAQTAMPAQPPLDQSTQAWQHAEVAQRSDGSSGADQRSSSGSIARLGVSQDACQLSRMRPPVSSSSADTAASSASSTDAAAGSSAAQATAVRQPTGRDATSWQHSGDAVHKSGISGVATHDLSNSISNGSPKGSRATAASTSEDRAGPMGVAPNRDTGFSSKPSRARAGVGAAGRQRKGKGASVEVSYCLGVLRCVVELFSRY